MGAVKDGFLGSVRGFLKNGFGGMKVSLILSAAVGIGVGLLAAPMAVGIAAWAGAGAALASGIGTAAGIGLGVLSGGATLTTTFFPAAGIGAVFGGVGGIFKGVKDGKMTKTQALEAKGMNLQTQLDMAKKKENALKYQMAGGNPLAEGKAANHFRDQYAPGQAQQQAAGVQMGGRG